MADDLARVAQELARLQKLRGWRERDRSIAGDILRVQQDTDRTAKRLARIVDVWDTIVEPKVASRTVIVGLRGGVLHVEADSSSTRFALDRILRGGALTELRRQSPTTIARVKVTVGAPERWRESE